MAASDEFEVERPRLVRLAAGILGDRHEAEDIVQTAWLRLHGADPDGIRSLPAWLTTVTTRLCLDRLRARVPDPAESTAYGEGLAVSGTGLDPFEEVALAEWRPCSTAAPGPPCPSSSGRAREPRGSTGASHEWPSTSPSTTARCRASSSVLTRRWWRASRVADEIIKAQDRHLREAVAAGDSDHAEAAAAMKARWRNPIKGMGWYTATKKAFAELPET